MAKKILIIDDNKEIRDLITEVLSDDFEVKQAENGNEGLDYIGDQEFDLIVLDMLMPVQGGIETILEVKRSFPNIKIIAISGSIKDLYKARLFKVDEVISKPFDPMKLLDEIRKQIALS